MQTPPNNLPRQTSAFVGRADDAMRVSEMLRRGSLVTIVGAGGIGKTRLALEVAAHLLNESTDGAWFVDLAPISEAALVAGTILSALDAPQSAGASALEQLVAYLRTRSLLLILDNCEHLVGEVASIVHTLLTRCPETAVLVTSREALGVSGEHEYHLATLDESSAVQLFADRARAANAHFVLDDGNRASVEKICRRLDGIALGIELAAARVKSMPVASIAERLELRMLTGGGRDRSARQQTMSALVGWSYDLLPDDEKAFFRRLAAFAGGMTLESVTAVCAGDELDEWGVLDLLTSLVDKSLLVAEPPEAPTRYRMLEPIREYARERLGESGETEDAFARHARGFAQIADRAYVEWDTAPSADWLERQERELDNIRAALRWSLEESRDPQSGAGIAGSVGPAFLRLSLLSEGIKWGDLALRITSDLPADVKARLTYTLSMLHNNLASYGAALEFAENAAELYRSADDSRGLVRALSQAAQQMANNAQRGRADSAAKEALLLARGLGDVGILASALARCANSAGSDEIDLARELYRESVALFRSIERNADAARVLDWWAGTEAVNGKLGEAARIIDEALPLSIGEAEMWTITTAVTVYWALGDRDRAAPLIRRALVLAGDIRHPIVLPLAVSYIALIAGDSDLAEAARLVAYADTRRSATGYTIAELERGTFDNLTHKLEAGLTTGEFAAAVSEGTHWSDEQAYARARRF